MADETRQASRIVSGGAAATALTLGVPAGHVVPLLALLVLAAFTWWLRAPLHAMPLDRDEGAYAVIAERWLAGDALYRDLFDHKPPLVYMVFSIAVLAPGDPVVAVRILATGYLLVIGASLYMLGLRLYGHRVAFVATALLLAYGSSRRFEGLIFNTEAILELPATLGCLFAVDALLEDRPLRLFWAGLCVGLAVLAKPIGIALLGPLLLVPLLARWPWQRAGIAAALSILGVVLPVMIFGLVLWVQGLVGAAAEALISYNQIYVAESLAQGWTPAWLWQIWAPMLALALPALLGFLVAWIPVPIICGSAWVWEVDQRRNWRAAHTTAALWSFALIGTALASLRPYPHYYMVAVSMLSLGAAACISPLIRWLRTARGHPWVGAALAGVVAIALASPAVMEVIPLHALDPQAQISALYAWDGSTFFAPAAAVAHYVADRVPRDEPIFVWAAEPQIYYLAKRRPAARFVYDYPVDRLPGARDALLARLRITRPHVIITYHDVRPIGVHPFFAEYGYILRTTIGGYDVFERQFAGG